MDYRILGKLGDQLIRHCNDNSPQGRVVFDKNLYAVQAIRELTGIDYELSPDGCKFFLDGNLIQTAGKPLGQQDIHLLLAEMLSKKYVNNIMINVASVGGSVHSGDMRFNSYKDYRIMKRAMEHERELCVIDENKNFVDGKELNNLINSKKVLENVKTLFSGVNCLAITLKTVQLVNSRYRIVYSASIS